MRLCRLGNEAAFETIYDRYFDKLVWFAFGHTDNMELAKDVVQDVFIRIIEAPERFDADRRFSTWVYTVVANACSNQLRNQRTRSRLNDELRSLLPETTGNADGTDFRLMQHRIKKLVDNLTEKERNIYLLRFEQELSIKEIAGILRLPEGSVKSGIFYLLRKLGKQLKEFTHG